MKLSSACKKELEQAEGRVQVLVEGKGGKMKPADLDLEPNESDETIEDEADDQE
jgi:exonuclease VII small subunit